MQIIHARNVNVAFRKMVNRLFTYGVRKPSRIGDVLEVQEPVTTVYSKPWERVLFSPERDANPFFHLMEALWMLAGKNDLETMEFYNRRMKDISDDGSTIRGAYGFRWRKWFDVDQLEKVIALLTKFPNSRRAVIQMWDAETDLRPDDRYWLDVPCNLICHVQLRTEHTTNREDSNKHAIETYLDLTVFCRSNDIIWGAAGTNSVHFSILQEYLAVRLGVAQGKLYQISNNFHAYVDVLDRLMKRGYQIYNDSPSYEDNYYAVQSDPMDESLTLFKPEPIVTDPTIFDRELHQFFNIFFTPNPHGAVVDKVQGKWYNTFFPDVAIPMSAAYVIFRRGKDASRYLEMLDILKINEDEHPISDWLYAAREWTKRRQVEFLQKEN